MCVCVSVHHQRCNAVLCGGLFGLKPIHLKQIQRPEAPGDGEPEGAADGAVCPNVEVA